MTAAWYRWAVVAMLWLVCVFNYADRQAIFSVFPLLQTEMDLSDVELGVVGGAFMWVYAAALRRRGLGTYLEGPLSGRSFAAAL